MAAITNYTDFVSLDEAKTYLRIDPDITETDLEITVMIDSACELVEQHTQVFLKPQEKTYQFNTSGYARVYAYPINSVTDETNYITESKQLYTNYIPSDSNLENVVMNVGHDDTDNVKSIFKQAVLDTVRLWFYGSETETVIKGYVPSSVMAILAQERRFIF